MVDWGSSSDGGGVKPIVSQKCGPKLPMMCSFSLILASSLALFWATLALLEACFAAYQLIYTN